MQAEEPYNPERETTPEEQNVAGKWELLRRNPAFQAVAQSWVESASFRQEHARSPQYHHREVHFPRCALDWLLSPQERVALARQQLREQRWFLDPAFNFGPMSCQRVGTRSRARQLGLEQSVQLTPWATAPRLRLDQDWSMTPEGFREQFRLAVIQRVGFQELTERLQRLGRDLERVAANPQPQPYAEGLDLAGMWLVQLAEFHHLFALPKGLPTPQALEAQLEAIRSFYQQQPGFDRRGRFNRHQSFQGTQQEWRWFLIAEDLQLDWRQQADCYHLAELYSDDLRQRGAAKRRNTKAAGLSGQLVPARLLRNRRATVRAHCQAIQRWIEQIYPPKG